MEDLTKSQLILLALLVSFITSIATGIVTVTLLEEAPEPVVQTINRVVERTVEKLVPAPAPKENNQGASVVTKETTIVVKEEDLITESIEKNSHSLVRISRIESVEAPLEAGEGQGILESPAEIKVLFIGLGSIVSSDGLVITDAGIVTNEGSYVGSIHGGNEFPLSVVSQDENLGIAVLKIEAVDVEELETDDKITSPTYDSVTFADASAFKLGQTVIALGGVGRDTVSLGIISGLVEGSGNIIVVEGGEEEGSPPKSISFIETTISSGDIIQGGPIFNIFGELIGMAGTDAKITHAFISVTSINEHLRAPKPEALEDTLPEDNQTENI